MHDVYLFTTYKADTSLEENGILWDGMTQEMPHFSWQILSDPLNSVSFCETMGEDVYVKNWTFGL